MKSNVRSLLRASVAAASLALLAAAPTAVQAHRTWLLPSSTTLAGNEPWVTVDGSVSNDLFYFERALRLDGLVITGPDGAAVTPENQTQGKLRSAFDLKLAKPGTYKISLASKSVMASYKLNGETKRFRGTESQLATEVPANAQELNVTRAFNRLETFVTSGKPSDKALQPTGEGLELVPVTHPNDLFSGEEAKFRFVLDGKPAANLAVTIIPGGIRYRDKVGELQLTTDAQGQLSVKWPAPGMYYLTASVGGGERGGPPGAEGGQRPPQPPAGGAPQQRASYGATLEVLPQ